MPNELDKKLDKLVDDWYDYDGGEWTSPDKEAIKALFLAEALELIDGAVSPHTPEAETHLNNPQYEYACCERVQASNGTLEELAKAFQAKYAPKGDK